MDILTIYGSSPDFLNAAANTPPMLRLKHVGMNCGCEYTSFPRFVSLASYNRWEHSVGVALIVWHFTQDPAQALSGLLHDVATPTFAHAIDFLRGDYLTQEATEAGTERIIAESPELQDILRSLDLSTQDVCDYHIYPIADNDSPRLSADRLEYTLGNLVNFGFRSRDEVAAYLNDLTVTTAEDGQPELAFRDVDIAHHFALDALRCSRIYVSDEDRYAMQALSELLKDAVAEGVLAEADFMGTEPALIDKLCSQPRWEERWRAFRALSRMRRTDAKPVGEGWRIIPAKLRCIDPMIEGQGRTSALFPDFSDPLAAFRSQSLEYWVRGE